MKKIQFNKIQLKAKIAETPDTKEIWLKVLRQSIRAYRDKVKFWECIISKGLSFSFSRWSKLIVISGKKLIRYDSAGCPCCQHFSDIHVGCLMCPIGAASYGYCDEESGCQNTPWENILKLLKGKKIL